MAHRRHAPCMQNLLCGGVLPAAAASNCMVVLQACSASAPVPFVAALSPLSGTHQPRTLAHPLAGEINFNIVGVCFQLGSIVSESIRLVLVQMLLQARALGVRSVVLQEQRFDPGRGPGAGPG